MKKQALELIVVAACASGLLGACSRESPDQMVASAKAYLEKKDSKAAVLQLKNALQNNPELPEARFLLGQTLMQSGDPVAASVELRKALDLHYPQQQVVPALARSLVDARDFRKLTTEFGAVTLPDKTAQADLKTSLAAAYAGQGEAERARTALNAALEAKPDYAPALVMEARLATAARQPDKAFAFIERALAADAANRDALQFKGDLLRAFRPADGDGAVAAYRKALEVDPSFLPARAGIVEYLLARNDAAAASTELAALRKSHPNHPQTVYLDAKLAYLNNDFKRAEELADTMLKTMGNNPQALELAGAVALRNQALVKAEDYLSKAVSLAPGFSGARRLLAQTYIQSGQSEKALKVLAPLLASEKVDAATLSLAANAEARVGDMKQAQAHLVRAAKLNPNETRSRVALALDHAKDGNVDSALREIETIAASDNGSFADAVLVNAYVRKGDLDQALKKAEAIEKKQPDKPFAANLRGRIQLLRKDVADARRSFERALTINPAYVPAAANLAMLDLQEKKPEAAKKRFETVLAADPKNTQALLALAGLQVRAGASTDEVAATLTKAIASNPSDVSPRLALVRHFLANKDVKRALTAAQEAVAALPSRPEALDALGRAQLASGDRNQAINSFNKLSAMLRNSPQPLLTLASIHMEAKQLDDARRDLQRALVIKPDLLAAQRGLVEVELQAGRTDEALALAHAVRLRQPASESGYLLEGSVEATRKNLAAAVDIYRAGLKQVPASTQLAVVLHGTLAAMDKPAEAEKFSSSWMKDHPRDARFLAYLGESALAQRKFAAAEGYLRQANQVAPGNVLVMNNLAWVMTQLNKPGAVEYAEKANALLPNKPVLMDTLAQALASEKQLTKAIEVEKQALSLAPDAHVVRLSLAKMYIQAGDKAAARKELDTLAKLEDKFSGQAEVRQLLTTL